ncbi:hypothetical protein [Mucilaginibacter xinganensis]|uniref:Poly A polymerase head domain-containing protein n=1 Tax=Mucilaginibacter xinganensis TaxID=1234841 RepID=A0A223P169_9SPHI|nr:hypothetical protein [Mucilaginibacter xinganensis]ASU35837.1 hypothetical protein MuYL_3952 [Mucilaginibacter xinganensis]
MAKKLIDIKRNIDSSGPRFYKYLHDLIHEDIMEKLDLLCLKTDVFLFSGIIRNYFLNIYLKRDIDVVIGGEINIYEEFKGLPITKNSFGGFKILFPSGPLDLWFIKDTWAFQHRQKTLNFSLEKKIPETAFFNFSTIIFSLSKKEFHYSEHFPRFLKYKELDYVYKSNPNYPLCVINTLYYSEKYNLSISVKLFSFIKELHLNNFYNYDDIQLKHFGEIMYSSEEINTKLLGAKKINRHD